jgi:hypothetical protein
MQFVAVETFRNQDGKAIYWRLRVIRLTAGVRD